MRSGAPVARVARASASPRLSYAGGWPRRRADVAARRNEGLTGSERKELAEMRWRDRVLETENEILKRASAYFAHENAAPKTIEPVVR